MLKHIPARPGRQEDKDGKQAAEAQERAFNRFAQAREQSRYVQALRGYRGGHKTCNAGAIEE